MLTKAKIEAFYEDVQRLGLKFPGAAIAKATGYSKGNVSQYLSRSLEPSEAFLQAFYKEFGDSLKMVPHEKQSNITNSQPVTGNADYQALYHESLLEQKRILEEQNQFLRRNFEVSLNSIVQNQDAVLLQLKTLAWFQADTRAGGDQKKVAEQLERMGNKAIELAGLSSKKDIPSGS